MAERLHRHCIVLTRPPGQNTALAERITQAGGHVFALPLLAIAPPLQAVSGEAFLAHLKRADWAIFISPNAVHAAVALQPCSAWPVGLQRAAVGKGTARALQAAGCEDVLTPSAGADSESLLALSALADLRGQRVLLVRGEGGRELLAQTLVQRGAAVHHAVLYRRVALPVGFAALKSCPRPLFVITSSEALRTLHQAAAEAGELAWFNAQSFLFAHPRIAEQGAQLGLPHGMMSASPEDDAVLAALMQEECND